MALVNPETGQREPWIPGSYGPYGTFPGQAPYNPGPSAYPGQGAINDPGPGSAGAGAIDVAGLIAGDAGYQGVRGALASQFASALGSYGGLGGATKPVWMSDAEWANAQAASGNPFGATQQAGLGHRQQAHDVYRTLGVAGGDTGATTALQGREDVRYTAQSQGLLNALRAQLAGYGQQEGAAYGQAADRVAQQYPGQSLNGSR